MKKVIYKSTAIQFIILLAAVIVLSTLWPLRLWKKDMTLSVTPATGTCTEAVNEEHSVMQTFLSQGNHLASLRLYPTSVESDGCFYVTILNEKQQVAAKEQVIVSKEAAASYVDVPMDLIMEEGKTYFLNVQGTRPDGMDLKTEIQDVPAANVTFAYEFITPDTMPGAGILYYDGEQIYGAGLAAEYHYSVPIGYKRTLAFAGGIVLAALLFLAVIRRIYKDHKKDSLITVERAFRFTANPLAALFLLAGFFMVFTGRLSDYALDNIFYTISLIFLAVILFYAINHNRDGQGTLFTGDFIREHLADGLQILFIAGAIAACCDYMNGLYEIHHQVAQRREMLFFALVILTMFSLKEILNRYTLLYAIAAGIAGVIYYHNGLDALAVREFKVEAEIGMNVEVLRNTVLIAVLFGFILLRTLICLCKRKLAKPNYWYGALTLLFFAGIVIFRNTRWWTVVLAVSFTLLYLSYGMWEHRRHFLTNVLWGIVLHFLISMGYALLHRPYLTYRYARYPFVFHTVTTTATYLTTVECAVIVLLLMKLYRTTKLREIYKELILFGIVSSYMLFTMARTGLFAVALTGLAAWLIIARGKGKLRVQSLLTNLGLMAAAVLVMFPVTFTLQRNIPGIVGEPVPFEIEEWPDQVMRGHNLTSIRYMRIGRFVDVFANKVFGIPEGTFDFYGEIAEYKATHDENGNEIPKLVASIDFIPSYVEPVYAESTGDLPEDMKDEEDYSNGRTVIFKSYFDQLNMTGHDEMGAVLPDGEVAVHAHNIYLQVAYDHGIGVGILFVIFGAASFVCALVFYVRKKETIACAALPMIVILSFAIAGMVEWIFHLSSPGGLVLMLVLAPLLYKEN